MQTLFLLTGGFTFEGNGTHLIEQDLFGLRPFCGDGGESVVLPALHVSLQGGQFSFLEGDDRRQMLAGIFGLPFGALQTLAPGRQQHLLRGQLCLCGEKGCL